MAEIPDPGPRRKGRAAIVVVAIVLAMVVAIFVGYNIQHARTVDKEEATGQQKINGLNGSSQRAP